MYKYKYKTIIKETLLVVVLLLTTNFAAAQQQDSLNRYVHVNEQNRKEPSDLLDLQKKYSTAAVVTVSGETLGKTTAANLGNTMYGLFPGMHVAQGSGEPGYDEAWMTIRGIGSYNYGSYAVYVDGFQTNASFFQYMTPAEIESVSILKDAAALATFGMKGANGVIWVVTKRGVAGKTKVKLQVRTGIQQPLQITKPLNSYDYASLYNEAVSNDNNRTFTPYYSTAQLDDYKSGKGVNTYWYNEVLKSSTPFLSTDASFSGGIEDARYFIMANFTKSQGLYNTPTDDKHSNAQLQQFNIRSNFDFKMFNIFEGKIDLGGRIEDRGNPGYSGGNLWKNLERYPNNIYPVKNENGSWTGTNNYPDNPVASIRELGYFSTRDRNLQASFSLKEKLDFITPGLYLTEAFSINNWTRGSYNVTKNYARFIGDVQQTIDKNTNYTIQDDKGTNQWNWNQIKAILGYDKQIGPHKLSSAFSYLQYEYNVDANQNGNAGINTNYAFQNIAGKVNYSYADKYIAEFGFAVSGSDNYMKGNRYGFYPTISSAWVLSNEEFLKESSVIGLLKLRASAGKSGYDGFWGPRYLYQQYYKYKGNYYTGNGTPRGNSGLLPAYTANPEIFAEESMKYNIGIDAQLFNNFSITADAFIDKRSGIVTQEYNMSDVYGIDAPYNNVGKVTTSGFEVNLQYSNSVGAFNYSIGGNVAFTKDKIDYMAELTPSSPNAWKTGNSIGTQFGYQALGFYDVTDFNPDGSLIIGLPVPSFGKVQPGDVKYANLNDDNTIDARDITKIGKADYPNLTYALTARADFKGFDLSLLFQGVASRDVNILDAARNKVIAFENNGNAYPIAQGRWAYYPDQNIDTRATATYPRLSTQGNNNNYQSSTLWIKNGNFIRLRNVEVGYNLPDEVLKQFKLSKVRIAASAVNLLTWSPLMTDYGMDPESLSGYPALKSYNLGLTVSF